MTLFQTENLKKKTSLERMKKTSFASERMKKKHGLICFGMCLSSVGCISLCKSSIIIPKFML